MQSNKAIGRSTTIITLPHGGLAVVHHDEIANTATVQGHGFQAVLPNNAPDVLEQAAQLAAPEERDLVTLQRIYGDFVVQPRKLDRSRVGDDVLRSYASERHAEWHDSESPVQFRDYAHALWGASKGDLTWPEYWDSVMRAVLRVAIAGC